MDGVIWGPTILYPVLFGNEPNAADDWNGPVRCIWLSAANPLCILRESIPKENHSGLTVTTQYLAYNLFLLEFVRPFADALIIAKNWRNDDCTADVWRSVNRSVLTKYANFSYELLLALTTAALGHIHIKMEELVTSLRTKDPYDVLPVSSNSSGAAGSSKGPSDLASSSTTSRSCSWQQAMSDGPCTIEGPPYGSYELVVRLPIPVITTVYNRLTEYGWMPTDSTINIALAESIWHLMGLSLPPTILEKDYPPSLEPIGTAASTDPWKLQPWVAWEPFGAVHLALRVNSLFYSGAQHVKLKLLFQGSCVFGCERMIQLRPTRLVLATDSRAVECNGFDDNAGYDWIILSDPNGENCGYTYIARLSHQRDDLPQVIVRDSDGGTAAHKSGVGNSPFPTIAQKLLGRSIFVTGRRYPVHANDEDLRRDCYHCESRHCESRHCARFYGTLRDHPLLADIHEAIGQ
jgi:hypothetical protein